MPASAAPNTSPKPLTETEFLRREAEEARRAISRMTALIGKNVGHSVDPRVWTRAHPLTALGAAIAAGFAAASVIPTADKRQRRKDRRRARALRKRFDKQFASAGSNGSIHDDRPSLGERIVHEVLILARPVILDLLAGMFRGQNAPVEPESNGHDKGMPPDFAGQNPPPEA